MQNTRFGTRSGAWSGIGRMLEGPAGWIITLVVLPVLLVLALLLPPVNLLDRLQAFTYTRITSAGGAITDPDGTVVNFPAEGVRATFQAAVNTTPREDFIEGQAGRDLYDAARNLPDHLIPKSPYYDLEVVGDGPGQAILTIPIPNDSMPYETLGVYTWDGKAWMHIPSTVLASEDLIESRLEFVPSSFMVMQTTPAVPAVTADLGLQGQLPPNAVVTNEARAGLYLRGDGALEGTAPVNSGNTLAVIRNWSGDTIRTDLINNLLIDPGLQENQLGAVEQTIVQNGYPGVVIDYRGVDAVPSARADFVFLMSKLAERLHANNKTLAVRVELPRQVSADSWDTLGYDWAGLGEVVDKLIIPAPIDPRAYANNSDMDALLRWATNQVERRKIQVEFTARSVERSGNYLLLKGYQDALHPLVGEVMAQSAGSNQQIALSLQNPRILSQVLWDENLGSYTYNYQDDQGLERTVYVETAGSVAHKLEMLQRYNVRNVSLGAEASGDLDPALWNVVLSFQQGQPLDGVPTQLSVVYSLYAPDGAMVEQQVRPVDDSRVVVNTPAGANEMRVDTAIVNSAGQALGAAQTTKIAMGGIGGATAAAPASQPASEESEAATAETAAVEAPAAAPAAAPVAAAPPAATEAIPTDRVTLASAQIVNLREGPGTNYPVVGQLAPGQRYDVTGKNEDGSWWQIDNGGQKAWIIGQLVSAAGDTASVAVAEDIPEPPVAQAPAAAPDAGSAAPPVVSAPAPSGGGSFGYGIQAHMVHNDQAGQVMAMTTGMGFNWVKQQIEWRVFEGSQGAIDFGSSDGIINAANAAGVNVLFSIVNAPAWAREAGHDGSVGGPPADPATYAAFVGAMAGHYCGSSLKAIEVWNEQNLHYEWGNKPLNPGEYVNLLAAAYAAIKGACPSMTVVSGALTPAGNNMPLAMDDFAYLEGMMQAGANNYLDGIGAHPSGYNVPPSATGDTACAAIQESGNSFNGACDSPHHSWSFRSTMEGYRNIANTYGAGNKLIWPTEFGWAAGGAYHPAYKYADDNSYEEQAAWTVEAYTMMRNWGWVGPAFLWNLNFRVVANGTEKAQWGIVGPGWEPLPAYNALRSMPK
ncbi:MAG: SH3 domain-containing protein [Caldilineaceae bacterium]|nr:SH3 domain-containing protein [Caldilineaceae bacterium]